MSLEGILSCPVSIIIAAYNSAGFIERAVISALKQDFDDLEVIVIDDGSTDCTCDIVRSLAAKDARLRLIRSPENFGPSAARNMGISAAKGDWIAVLDADDAFANDRLTNLVAIAECNKCDIITDNFVFFNMSNGDISRPAMESSPSLQGISLEYFVKSFGENSSDAEFGLLKPVFSRKFLNKTGLRYSEGVRHGEDWDLIFEALKLGAHYLLARNHATYFYTTRDSGFSKTRIDYPAMASRILNYSKIAKQEGDLRLARLLNQRADKIRRVHLDYLGSMPSPVRPRRKMILMAASSIVGWRWLFARLKARLKLTNIVNR